MGAILGFIGAFLLLWILFVNALGASAFGWVFGFILTIVAVCMVVENANKEEEAKKQREAENLRKNREIDMRYTIDFIAKESDTDMYEKSRFNFEYIPSYMMRSKFESLKIVEDAWGFHLHDSPHHNAASRAIYEKRLKRIEEREEKERQREEDEYWRKLGLKK